MSAGAYEIAGSLIRVLAVCLNKLWVLSYPQNTKRRLRSDWTNAKAGRMPRLIWVFADQVIFVGFVMLRLK